VVALTAFEPVIRPHGPSKLDNASGHLTQVRARKTLLKLQKESLRVGARRSQHQLYVNQISGPGELVIDQDGTMPTVMPTLRLELPLLNIQYRDGSSPCWYLAQRRKRQRELDDNLDLILFF
jgi:hypothetical protein